MTTDKTVFESIKDRIREAGPETSRDIKYVALDLATLLVTLMVYTVAAASIGALVYKILAVGGIEAVLAQLMAATCINRAGIPCDFNTLLAGVGLTLVILTGLAVAVLRETVKMENVSFQDLADAGPCRAYTEEMSKVLRYVQALGGVDTIEGLKGLGNWLGIPYTTMRRYMEQFKKDGYITIESNGRGAPVQIRLRNV